MRKFIYLAGPVLGCDKGEANDWRAEFSAKLGELGGYTDAAGEPLLVGVSPLRCEPLIGERYGPNYPDAKFGTPGAIAAKNLLDVQTCDLTLAYFPREITKRKVSLGTVVELAWAKALGKPTILVSTAPVVREHPVIQACAPGWQLDTLDEALEVIHGVFNVYTG